MPKSFHGPRQNCLSGVKIVDIKKKVYLQKVNCVPHSSSRFLGYGSPPPPSPKLMPFIKCSRTFSSKLIFSFWSFAHTFIFMFKIMLMQNHGRKIKYREES